MAGVEPSWKMTDRERKRAGALLAATIAAAVGGPLLAPFAALAFEYLYERRDRIFNASGAPLQAYTADRSALNLNTLSRRIAQPHSVLSIDTSLTGSARKLGLRDGDPVSVMVAGHQYVQSRSGIVVPARIGERINVTVPNGSYSVAALGSSREALFTARDPYNAVAGNNISLQAAQWLALPLTARNLLEGGWRPPANAAEQLQCYGAIAYSQSTGLIGWSWRATSSDEAKRAALSHCQARDAAVVGFGQNCHICLATGPGHGYGWAAHADATTAMNNALALCRQYGEAYPQVVALIDTRRGALQL
jgi:hypothetical protein